MFTPWAVSLFLSLLFHNAATQADGPLAKNTAIYILIAIAAVYFALTALCLILVVYVCYCNHFFKKKPAAGPKQTESIPLSPIKEKSKPLPEKEKDQSKGSFGYSPIPKTPVSRPPNEPRKDDSQPPLGRFDLTVLAPVHKRPNVRRGRHHEADGQPQVHSNKLVRHRGISPMSIRATQEYVEMHQPSHKSVINPGYLEESVPTVLLLKNELLDISHKWFSIGRQLLLPIPTLNTIQRLNKTDNELCLMTMCEQWLQKESNPRWATIVGVLESRLIDEGTLAHTLREKYSCTDANYSPTVSQKKSACDLDLDVDSFSRI